MCNETVARKLRRIYLPVLVVRCTPDGPAFTSELPDKEQSKVAREMYALDGPACYAGRSGVCKLLSLPFLSRIDFCLKFYQLRVVPAM